MHPAATPPTPAPASPPNRPEGMGSAALREFSLLVMSLPAPLRALVAIAIVAAVGAVLYQRYGHVPDDSLRQAAQYTNGVADPTHAGADSTNPQNIEAAHKALEDQSAAAWHFTHETDDHPPEMPIDPERKVYYRYFANSDHCVFIRRRDGAGDHMQWDRDPSYHEHDVDMGAAHTPHHADVKSTGDSRLSAWLTRAVNAVTPAASAQGTCLNPHPGQFRYWWGQPLDQCNSPMFRQFGDGCVHYQIYNRCANAWDSRINWTMCVAQHHS